MNFNTIFFDFDYTLVDSSLGVIECTNYALEKLGFQKPSTDSVRKTIGLSLADTYKQLVRNNSNHTKEEFIKFFVERANSVMNDLTVMFEYTGETVEMLKKCGFKLGIVSSKFRYRIESFLEKENLLDKIDVIIGGEDVDKPKPNPEGIFSAIRKIGVNSKNVLFVGDSTVDAQTAMRANVAFIAVLSGVTSKSAFSNYTVLRYLKNIYDLRKCDLIGQ
ncbi:MAG: hypothetical protein A2V66_05790 [Ignavibacteria bacterium RBG_13_36_8]|nr:MAG: hypothetical protein A2V66_05790 [Ignavibacteria bacterium RBG_13_36_8]